jgi:hypothetical protein
MAIGHLWRATQALFESHHSSRQASLWFSRWRHQLRHGQHYQAHIPLVAAPGSIIILNYTIKKA